MPWSARSTAYGLEARAERRLLSSGTPLVERWRVHVKTARGERFSPALTVPIDVAGEVATAPALVRLRARYPHLRPQAESFVVPTFTA